MARDYVKLYEQVLNGKALHAYSPTLTEAPGNKLLSMEA